MEHSLIFDEQFQIMYQLFHFFHQNLERTHWVSFCLCNPWYFLCKYYKNMTTKLDELPEVLENMGDNDFIHGFLYFDLQKGFVKQEDMTKKNIQYCNA